MIRLASAAVRLALLLACVVACGSHGSSRRVRMPSECGSFEVVVVRGVRRSVSVIRGVVYLAGNDELIPLPDVDVRVRRLGGGDLVATTTTGADGTFAFPRLANGWYQVEACKFGFTGLVMPVHVEAGAQGDHLEMSVRFAS